MRRIFLSAILLAFAGSTCAIAQSLQYRKTEDNPEKAINTMINIVPVDAFMPTGKYSGLNIGIGAQAAYGLTSRLGFEGNLVKSYISTNPGGSLQLDGGAFLNFRSKEKTKKTRVITGYRRDHGVSKTVTTTSYFEVPARVKIATGVRGGAYYSNSTLKTDGIKIAKAESAFNLAGVYVGLQSTNKHFIKTQMQNENEPSPTAALFKIYADALIFPVSKIEDDFMASKVKGGNLGGRAGINWVIAPYTKKEHPNYRPILHRLVVNAELGSRPVDGFYAKMGFAYGIIYK